MTHKHFLLFILITVHQIAQSQGASSITNSAFVTAAKEELTRDFLDPDAARFRNLYLIMDKVRALCGEVNAKNKFGAYSGFRPFYALDRESGEIGTGIAPEDPSDTVFTTIYRGSCSGKRKQVK